MRTEPDPADLYPDVAAAGTLATALQTAGAARGLPLVAVPTESDPLRRTRVASAAPGREALIVSGWHWERRWSIDGSGRGRGSGCAHLLISGSTDELGAIPQVAVAWRDGVSLAEIERLAPFVELSGHYEVPDDSPAHQIASQWGYLRQEARTAAWPTQVELIEAAYARPELRQLYAFTSHWALRFSTVLPPERPTSGNDEISLDTISLEASSGGGFTVRAPWMGPVLAEATMADEAVSLALRLTTGVGLDDRQSGADDR